MQSLQPFGKLFIIAGLIFLVIGILISFSDKIPFFGKMPGDIEIRRENFSFYFPIVTSIILSIIISLILYLINKFKN